MPTIEHIANLTGYSIMTVSRVFNAPEKVKPETRETILRVAEKLDYHPNNVARSLARKCTHIVYVYIPKGLSATEQFVSQTITAIGERLGEEGYSLLFSRNLPEGTSYDGLIMMGISNDEEKEILALQKIWKPTVLYGNSDDFSSWVDVDNYNGEKLAVQYLIDKGHRQIAMICAPQNMHYAQERLCAYKDTLVQNGICVDDEMICECSANEKGGYLGTRALLDKRVDIDAIVCATDNMAIGCVRALKEMGLNIPDDVAVMGYDGFGNEKLVIPRLTTIKQPLFEVGVKLADTLLALMKGGAPDRIKILPSLVENQSV